MQKLKESPFFSLSSKQVLELLQTSSLGISAKEAEHRLQQHGTNKIKKKQNWFFLEIIAGQFNNALVWILLVAALLANIFGQHQDMVIILLIVFINSAIGFFQEYKAEKTLKKIKELTGDDAVVIRNGQRQEISSEYLVPGDILALNAGDKVPADGYLIEEYDLYVNDFIFTGESSPNKKHTGALKNEEHSLGELKNMVFMGSLVTRGEGLCVVTATAMNTELGKIADKVTDIHSDETPLQKKLKTLGREVSVLSILIGLVVIIVARSFGITWYESFLFALALAVSVVPEGLPAALSVALSLGMKRLLKGNVLAKKLTAVETLGSVSVICTDKTGTITRNELMVTTVVLGAGKLIEIDGQGFIPKGDFYAEGRKIDWKKRIHPLREDFEMLLKIGLLCNDAQLVKTDGKYSILGDPTEGALVVAAQKYNSKVTKIISKEKKVEEYPFTSERMRMSVIYKNSETISYVKGSPEIVLERCNYILEKGAARKITKQERENIKALYNQMSEKALRSLGFAYRDMEAIDKKHFNEEAERNLVWVGLMGMIDPPRKDVAKAIDACQKAGIKVIMITGDYEVTARAIAKNVGLLKSEKKDMVISGKMLQAMSDEAILDRVKHTDVVFARINPEQKLRIASLLKHDGMVIAMTGDGVNDALALKRADIGVAMGNIGTDVAKEAGDMILLDDNFASIVKAVKEGRVIYQNIKKFVHYVFTSNASELFTVVLGVIFQIPTPLTAIQILATDLGTDLFPSLALGVDPAEPNIMKTKARDSKDKVLNIRGFLRITYLGILMAACAVITFVWSMKRGGWTYGEEIDKESWLYIKSTTATYGAIAMTQMANLLQSRSELLSVFQLGFFKNRYAIASIALSVGIFFSFMYLPILQRYLKLSPIDIHDWLAIICSVILIFVMEEMRKWFVRSRLGRKAEGIN